MSVSLWFYSFACAAHVLVVDAARLVQRVLTALGVDIVTVAADESPSASQPVSPTVSPTAAARDVIDLTGSGDEGSGHEGSSARPLLPRVKRYDVVRAEQQRRRWRLHGEAMARRSSFESSLDDEEDGEDDEEDGEDDA